MPGRPLSAAPGRETPPPRLAALPAAAAPAPARSHARSHAPRRPPEAAHSDARGERAGIGGCAEAPPRRQSGPSPGRMLRCGARRPPQATRARIPQKFGSGSVGSEMQPKPRFPRSPAQINTHKHAHRRRRGPHSQPRGPGIREGKSPGPEGSPASPGSPRRGRSPSPLAGATEAPGVTGPEQRRNGRSGPAASAAWEGRERPPDTAGRRGRGAGGEPGRDGRHWPGRAGSRCVLRTRGLQPTFSRRGSREVGRPPPSSGFSGPAGDTLARQPGSGDYRDCGGPGVGPLPLVA